MKRFPRAFMMLALCGLAACSSGAQSASPIAPAPGATAATPASATFRVTVPATTATSSSTRKAAYVSASTQSVIITLTAVAGKPFTGSPASIASNLTPANPNCTGTPLTCTVTAPGVPGTDTFTVVMYDAQQTAASPATPAGNVLSQATLSATILANAANTIPVVVNGVPAAIVVTGLPGATAGTALAAQSFIVMVKDAGGNTIVGSYANPVTLTNSDTSGALTIATAGADLPPANELISSNDVASLVYTGRAIAPATIGAGAPNAGTATASFAPALQPILTDAPSNTLALSSSTPSIALNASEIGWTNAPYNQQLTISGTSGCSTIGTLSPASGTAFTASAAGSPVPGSCTFSITDFTGGSSTAVTMTYVNSGSQTFSATNAAATFTVPAGITSITVDATGAQGGGNTGGGAEVSANIAVTPGETLQVNAGGSPSGQTGGWNGGGGATDGCNSSGGGASDVRQGGTALADRVIVAAASGGGGCDQGHGGGGGGAGGTSTGGNGQDTNSGGGGGQGGTLSSGGAGGVGGIGTYTGIPGDPGTLGNGGFGGAGGGDGVATDTALGGAGGGGGYYGGGGGGGGAGQNVCCTLGGGGGAGGSSYAEPSATQLYMNAGSNYGSGSVTITWPATILPSSHARSRPAK